MVYLRIALKKTLRPLKMAFTVRSVHLSQKKDQDNNDIYMLDLCSEWKLKGNSVHIVPLDTLHIDFTSIQNWLEWNNPVITWTAWAGFGARATYRCCCGCRFCSKSVSVKSAQIRKIQCFFISIPDIYMLGLLKAKRKPHTNAAEKHKTKAKRNNETDINSSKMQWKLLAVLQMGFCFSTFYFCKHENQYHSLEKWFRI